jgi:hypothetical protein
MLLKERFRFSLLSLLAIGLAFVDARRLRRFRVLSFDLLGPTHLFAPLITAPLHLPVEEDLEDSHFDLTGAVKASLDVRLEDPLEVRVCIVHMVEQVSLVPIRLGAVLRILEHAAD